MPTKSNPDSPKNIAARSVADLTSENIKTIAELEKSARVHRSRGEQAVDAITNFFGEIKVVYIHLIFFSVWIVSNTLLPKNMHFDPYPFEFLVLALSLEAIFLSFFIIITQKRQGEIDQRRNHLDLQINLLTEQENTKVLWTLKRIAEHMGVDLSEDPDLQILDEATKPEKLIEQIDKSMKER